METLIGLIAFLLCIVVPIALVVAAIVWIVRKVSNPSAASVPSSSLRQESWDEFDGLVMRWVAQGRLSSDVAAQVRGLIAEERPSQTQPADASAPDAPTAIQLAEVAPVGAASQAPPADETTPVSAPMPAPLPVAPPPVLSIAASAPAAPHEPWGERLGQALLSLRTRQTLLFLGAFLLVVSALVLVVFNWASFPPILQFALLVGVCGGLWAAGTWFVR